LKRGNGKLAFNRAVLLKDEWTNIEKAQPAR